MIGLNFRRSDLSNLPQYQSGFRNATWNQGSLSFRSFWRQHKSALLEASPLAHSQAYRVRSQRD